MVMIMQVRKDDILQAVSLYADKKVFLFDMDGLIFDSERVFMEQLAVVMRERGYSLTREVYLGTLGLGGQQVKEYMVNYYGGDYSSDDISKETAARVRIVAETVGISVKPGIRETLEWLKEREIPCAVVSSSSTDTIAFNLEQAGLRPYFCQLFGGELVTRSKPSPECYLLACKKLGVAPQDCVVLEDSENGVRAGYGAGCSVICVPDLKWPEQEVLELAEVVVCKN